MSCRVAAMPKKLPQGPLVVPGFVFRDLVGEDQETSGTPI